MAWRRVTKSESLAGWKARRYTDGVRTISRVEYERLTKHPETTYHKFQAARLRQRGYTSQGAKATRQRKRALELRELMRRYSIIPEDEATEEDNRELSFDARVIEKYIKERRRRGKSYKESPRHFRKNGKPMRTEFEKDFSAAERQRFKELFENEIHQYPDDMVRRWLGSDERSIAMRKG